LFSGFFRLFTPPVLVTRVLISHRWAIKLITRITLQVVTTCQARPTARPIP
jgi:hypothetical protein